MGVSMLATRLTGASNDSKQCSLINAATSLAILPNNESSCKKIAFPVLRTDLYIDATSKGCNVLRSKRSALISGCLFKVSKAQ